MKASYCDRKPPNQRGTCLMSPSVTDSGKAGHLTVSCIRKLEVLKYRSVGQQIDLGVLDEDN